MVVCRDNSVLAQLGTPDMRVPIAYGLSPQRIESGASQLDFTALAALSFEPADFLRLPGLAGLAWRCAPRRAARRCSMPPTRRRWRRSWAEPSASTRFTASTPARWSTSSATRRGGLADGLLGLDAGARHARQLIRASCDDHGACLHLHARRADRRCTHGHYRVAVACGVKVLRFRSASAACCQAPPCHAAEHRVRGLRAAAGRLRAHARRARGPGHAPRRRIAFNRKDAGAAHRHRRRRAAGQPDPAACCCTPAPTGSAWTNPRR